MIEIRVSYCAIESWIWFLWIGIDVNLYIRRLLRLFANYSTNFWTTASRFFIIEPAFCEHDKNHKFDNSKTQKNLFFNEVAFYFIWLLHCIKIVCKSLYSVWMWENAYCFYAVLCYKRCWLNLIWIWYMLCSFVSLFD